MIKNLIQCCLRVYGHFHRRNYCIFLSMKCQKYATIINNIKILQVIFCSSCFVNILIIFYYLAYADTNVGHHTLKKVTSYTLTVAKFSAENRKNDLFVRRLVDYVTNKWKLSSYCYIHFLDGNGQCE
jgi:hypothetical protein